MGRSASARARPWACEECLQRARRRLPAWRGHAHGASHQRSAREPGGRHRAAHRAGDSVGVIGFITVGAGAVRRLLRQPIYVLEQNDVIGEMGHEFHGAVAFALHGFTALPFLLALAGVVTAWVFFLWKPSARRLARHRMFSWLRTILVNKYYFDWINENIIAAGVAPARPRPVARRRSGHHRRRAGERHGRDDRPARRRRAAACRAAISTRTPSG